MGLQLPSPNSPREKTLALMARKDAIQTELDAQFSILQANQCKMNTPLIDAEGFPRADIDVWEVRHARVKIIMLRNDMEAVMNDIAKALEGVYEPSAPSEPGAAASAPEPASKPALQPFARVDGIAPSSPASDAGLKREDLLLKFGALTADSFTSNTLAPLAELVSSYENRPLAVTILRDTETMYLTFTPRKGWGGRGMLGCHLVPYAPS